MVSCFWPAATRSARDLDHLRRGAYRRAFALALALLSIAAGEARETPLWGADQGSRVAAEYRWLSSTQLDVDGGAGKGSIEGRRSGLALQWDSGFGLVLGLGHEYNSLDIQLDAAGTEPATNGDLHTLYASVAWDWSFSGGSLRLALAPAVSASSNAIKEPDQLDGDSAQLWAAAVVALEASRGEWLLGAARDHRFGEARTYPVAGWRWHRPPWHLRLAYPDVLLARELGDSWRLGLSLAPDGNEWQAFDDDLERGEAFVREAWLAELRLSRSWGERFEMALSAGWFWDQHWRFSLAEGGSLRAGSDDSYALGLHLQWWPGGL